MSCANKVHTTGVQFQSGSLVAYSDTSVAKFVEREKCLNRQRLNNELQQSERHYQKIVHGARKHTGTISLLESAELTADLRRRGMFVPEFSVVHQFGNETLVELDLVQRRRTGHLPHIARSWNGDAETKSFSPPRSVVLDSQSLPDEAESHRFWTHRSIGPSPGTTPRLSSKDIWREGQKAKLKHDNNFKSVWDSSKVFGARNSWTPRSKAYCADNAQTPQVVRELTNHKEIEETPRPNSVASTYKDTDPEIKQIDKIRLNLNGEDIDDSSPGCDSDSNEEEARMRKRQEHTRELLREAVQKLREIEIKYKDPKNLLRKSLRLRNALDSIPENSSEHGGYCDEARPHSRAGDWSRRSRHTNVIRPTLEIVQKSEFSSESGTSPHHRCPPRGFRGNKLFSNHIKHPPLNAMSQDLTQAASEHSSLVTLGVSSRTRPQRLPPKDIFKSRRIFIGRGSGFRDSQSDRF